MNDLELNQIAHASLAFRHDRADEARPAKLARDGTGSPSAARRTGQAITFVRGVARALLATKSIQRLAIRPSTQG